MTERQAKTTFEEACRIQWELTRPADFQRLGPEEVIRRMREGLARAGWTSAELCDEAAKRMKARIEKLAKMVLRFEEAASPYFTAVRECADGCCTSPGLVTPRGRLTSRELRKLRDAV